MILVLVRSGNNFIKKAIAKEFVLQSGKKIYDWIRFSDLERKSRKQRKRKQRRRIADKSDYSSQQSEQPTDAGESG